MKGIIMKTYEYHESKSYDIHGTCRGVSSGELRGLEHPPKVWHNSQLSSCVTTIVTDKQQ